MNRYVRTVAIVAFLWRLVLTTGTASIFGFLIAREAYDLSVMAPLFIAMSFSYGSAVYILVLLAACRGSGIELGDVVLRRLGRLMGACIAVVLFITVVQHLTGLYEAERAGAEHFILVDGGIYTVLFWTLQVGAGGLLPLALLFWPPSSNSLRTSRGIALASALVIAGGLAQVYVIVIGGQAWPLNLFPGMEVSSGFHDGVVASYTPGLAEIGLGLGGVALAGLIVLFGIKVLQILPATLSNSAVDSRDVAAAVRS